MSALLALDPATKCGFAFTASGRLREARTGVWKARRVEHAPDALAAAHSGSLRAFLAENDVDYAIVEKPVSAVMKSVTTQNALWCLHGALVAVLSHHGIPYRAVQPNEWRKAVFGNGSIGSEEAKRAALDLAEHEGIDAVDHNAAEAFAVLVHLQQQHQRWALEDRAAA